VATDTMNRQEHTLMSFRKLAILLARMNDPPVQVSFHTLRQWAHVGRKVSDEERRLRSIWIGPREFCCVAWVREFLQPVPAS